MARRRIFFGRSQEWCEQKLAEAQEEAAAGTTSIGGSEGDVSFTEQVGSSIQQRIDDLLLELSYLDPAKYPRNVARLTRVTRMVFRPGC